MNNLSPHKRKLKEAFSIADYMTEVERSIYESDCNPDQEEFEFVRYQSKYICRGGSKSGNTELRIAGSVLHLINAMIGRVDKGGSKECRVSFTKADIARMVQDEAGEGITERTVQRYLQTVLEKLKETYGICSEVKNGRAGCIYVWTAELDALEQNGQREFDTDLIKKTKSQNLRNTLYFPLSKRETKRSILTIIKAKGESFNKRNMIKHAFGLVRQKELPYFKNLEISNWDVVNLLVERLGQYEWRESAWKSVMASLLFTDRAMTEYSIANPVGYARHNLRTRKVDVASKEDMRKERLRQAKSVSSKLRADLPKVEANEKFLLDLAEQWRHEMTDLEYANQIKSASKEADSIRRKISYFESKVDKLVA